MVTTRALRHGSLIALVTILLQFSSAKDVYLDCSSTSSGGDGSHSHPFNSLDEANQAVLGAGDTLSVKAGTTCFGTLSPQGSGTQQKPIMLSSYGDGPLPIINGSGATEAVRLTNQDYWDISKIAVINPAPKVAWRRGILATSDDGSVHRGLYIHDVTVYNVAGETNKATHANAFVASGGILVNGTEHHSRYDDVQVYNNTVYDCGGGGIKVRVGQMGNRGQDTHVWNNNISYVGGDGIVVSYGASPLIEGNLCGYLGHGKYPWTGGNFAGIWVLGCRDAVMRFNAVHDSLMSLIDSEAFDCDWGNEGTCTVEYNYSHDNAGGIFLNCDGCGTPGGAKQIIRYNIFQNDCRMYSNGDNVEMEFYNNVVYCPNKDFEIAVPPQTNLSNNIWVGTADSTLPTGESIEWRANLFQTVSKPDDTAGTTGDPHFINPGTGKDSIDSVDGYRLRSQSPALLQGVVVEENGGRDFWNNAVSPVDRPNIGAYNGKGL
ncbi:hypothetical protein ETB97_007167 [Aspergillus alliaceus]|uniref:Pectin lyase fold/virulence factor n=1 Tax=Petromyces alliaceus TaxID=209559 RepID=A0A5N7CG97_PETAA|nr:pectin lyase fold/virulence factor [Aspergillus alliaceus]KAF5864609.1 hypothetical protein ETB97_007167 [Aspergillus burnettii]